jgi:hypothetical protein
MCIELINELLKQKSDKREYLTLIRTAPHSQLANKKNHPMHTVHSTVGEGGRWVLSLQSCKFAFKNVNCTDIII